VILSVVIPTRNRANLLAKALKSLESQTMDGGDYEIIVVDNGSSDNTKEVCKESSRSLGNLRYIHEPRPGLHMGRHAGLREAQGEILVYGDDDIVVSPTWLEAVKESFEMPDVGLVGGRILPSFEVHPPTWIEELWVYTPWGKALGQYSILDFGQKIKEISPFYVWGCNFSVKKDLLFKIGGFHPDGMPLSKLRYRGDGETAISRVIENLGLKTLYHPNAAIEHWVSKERMTFDYLRHRSYIQGISDSYTQIRRDNGLMPGQELKNSIRKAKMWMKEKVPSSRKNKLLTSILRQGYWEGFQYHRNEAKLDPELQDWILKKDYFNE